MYKNFSNDYFKEICKIFQSIIILQDRTSYTPLWSIVYIIRLLSGKKCDWCSYISDRIKYDMKFSLQNDNSYVACTNFIFAFNYEYFHNFVNIAPIPIVLHSQMTTIALPTEEI